MNGVTVTIFRNIRHNYLSKRHRYGRIVSLAGVAGLLLVGSVAPGGLVMTASATAAVREAVPATGKTVVLVSTQQSGDEGPVDNMIAYLKMVATKFKAKTKFIYASDPSSYVQTLKSVGESKANIVVVPFPTAQSAVKQVAPEFPGTKWIEVYADPFSPPIPNVRTIGFDQYRGFYLSGVMAALVTKTNSIGYIAGIVAPSINADYHAYYDGAKSVNPKVKVTGAAVGSLENPTGGYSIGASMIAKGIDIIQTDAAATSLGVIKAAKAGKAFVITDASGQTASQYPATVMGTSFLYFGLSLYSQVQAALTPGWKGGAVTSGFADGEAGLAVSPYFLKNGSPQAAAIKKVQPRLNQMKAEIIKGTIKVPYDTASI
jgi:basic membrane protein A and related proteins